MLPLKKFLLEILNPTLNSTSKHFFEKRLELQWIHVNATFRCSGACVFKCSIQAVFTTFADICISVTPLQCLDIAFSVGLVFSLFFSDAAFASTQHPRYNATRYNAISATMLIFLGSQIIFKKYQWGWVDIKFTYFCSNRKSIFTHIIVF